MNKPFGSVEPEDLMRRFIHLVSSAESEDMASDEDLDLAWTLGSLAPGIDVPRNIKDSLQLSLIADEWRRMFPDRRWPGFCPGLSSNYDRIVSEILA